MTDAESFLVALAIAEQFRAIRDLQTVFGGNVLTMPLTADTPSRARDLLGAHCLTLMIDQGFGGRGIPILSGPDAANLLRREMTAHFMAAGKSTAYIATKVGIPERQVIQIKRELRAAGR